MAISDKVIDLAPVKKGRTAIFFIIIGILAAASVAFLALWILKPAAIEAPKLTIEAASDFYINKESGKAEASVGGTYKISVDMGVASGDIGQVNTAPKFEYSPIGAIAGEPTFVPDENVANRYWYVFSISSSLSNDTNIKVTIKSQQDEAIFKEVNFLAKMQFADSVSVEKISQGNTVYPLSDNKLTVPFFAGDENFEGVSNEYTVTAVQTGLKGANDVYAQITRGIKAEGNKNYLDELLIIADTLDKDTDGDGIPDEGDGTADSKVVQIVSMDTQTDIIKLALKSTGYAKISIVANTFNDWEDKEVSFIVNGIKTSETGKITKVISSFGSDITMFTNELFDLSSKITFFPETIKDPWKNIDIYSSDNKGNRESSNIVYCPVGTKNIRTQTTAGMAYVTVKDMTKPGYGAMLTIRVNVKMAINAIDGLIDGKKPDAGTIGASKGSTKEMTVNYSLPSTVTDGMSNSIDGRFSIAYEGETAPIFDENGNVTNAQNIIWVEGATAYTGTNGAVATYSPTLKYSSASTESVKLYTGKIKFNIGTDVPNGTHSLTFFLYPQTSQAGGEVMKIKVSFTVSVVAMNIDFNYDAIIDKTEKYASFVKKDNTTATLTLNVPKVDGSRTAFSLADLINYYDANGKAIPATLDQDGYALESANTKKTSAVVLPSHGNDPTIIEELQGVLSKIKYSKMGISTSLKIELKTGVFEGSTEKTSTRTLIINMIDNAEKVEFVDPSERTDLFYPTGSGLDTLSGNDELQVTYYSGNSGKYKNGMGQDYAKLIVLYQNIVLHEGENLVLLTRKGDYFYYPGDEEKGDKFAMFVLNSNNIVVKTDLYTFSQSKKMKCDKYSVFFSLENISDLNALLAAKDAHTAARKICNVKRVVDEVKFYTDAEYNLELPLKSEVEGKIYTYKVSKGSDFILYPSGVIGSFVVNAPENAALGLNVSDFSPISQGSMTNPTVIRHITERGNMFEFNATGSSVAGEKASTVLTVVSLSKKAQIEIEVEDNTLKIDAIKIYSDSNCTNEISALDLKYTLGTVEIIENASIVLPKTKKIYYKIFYEPFNSQSHTKKDMIKVAIGDKNLVEVKEQSEQSQDIQGFTEGVSGTFSGSFVISSKSLNGNVEVRLEASMNQSSAKSDIISFELTTPFSASGSALKSDSFSEDALRFALNNNSGETQLLSIRMQKSSTGFIPMNTGKNFTIEAAAENGLSADSNKIQISSVNNGENLSVTKDGKHLRIFSADKILNKTILEITVVNEIIGKGANYRKEFKVYIPVEVKSDVYSVEYLNASGDAPINEIKLNTNGKNNEKAATTFTLRINEGKAEFATDILDADIICYLSDAAGIAKNGNSLAVTHIGGVRSVSINDNVTSLSANAYYVATKIKGVIFSVVPISLTTNAVSLSLENENYNSELNPLHIFSVGTEVSILGTVKNLGTNETLTTAVTYDIESQTIDGVTVANIVTQDSVNKHKFTITGTKGEIVLIAKVRASNAAGEFIEKKVYIKISNLVSDVTVAPHANATGIADSVDANGKMLKMYAVNGYSFDINSYVTLKGTSGGAPYASEYTVTSSNPSVVLVANKTLTAKSNGRAIITVTANAPSGETPKTHVFTIEVVTPTFKNVKISKRVMDIFSDTNATVSYDVYATIFDIETDLSSKLNDVVISSGETTSPRISVGAVSNKTANVTILRAGFTTAADYTKPINFTVNGKIDGVNFSSTESNCEGITGFTAVYVSNTDVVQIDGISSGVNELDTTNKHTFTVTADVTKTSIPGLDSLSYFTKFIKGVGNYTLNSSTGEISGITGSGNKLSIGVVFTIYGKEFSFISREFTVINSSSISQKIYLSTDMDFNNSSVKTEITNYSVARIGSMDNNYIFIEIDFSLIAFDFTASDEARFRITGVLNELTKIDLDGASDAYSIYDITNKKYVVGYKLNNVSADKDYSNILTVTASLTDINGLNFFTPTTRVELATAKPIATFTAGNGTINPGETTSLSHSLKGYQANNSESVIPNNAQYSLSADGSESENSLITLANNSITAKKNTLGGSVTVYVKFTVTDGLFKGQEILRSISVVINSYAPPTVSLNKTLENITVGKTYSLKDCFAVNFDAADNTANSPTVLVEYVILENGNATINQTNGTISPNEVYSVFSVQANIKINGGYFDGKTLTANIPVTVLPSAVITADNENIKYGEETGFTVKALDKDGNEITGLNFALMLTAKETVSGNGVFGAITLDNKFSAHKGSGGDTKIEAVISFSGSYVGGKTLSGNVSANTKVTTLGVSVLNSSALTLNPGDILDFNAIGLKINSVAVVAGDEIIVSELNTEKLLNVENSTEKATVKVDANFTGAVKNTVIGVTVKSGGKEYYNEFTLIIKNKAKPGITISEWQADGALITGDTTIFGGSSIDFKVTENNGYAITSEEFFTVKSNSTNEAVSLGLFTERDGKIVFTAIDNAPITSFKIKAIFKVLGKTVEVISTQTFTISEKSVAKIVAEVPYPEYYAKAGNVFDIPLKKDSSVKNYNLRTITINNIPSSYFHIELFYGTKLIEETKNNRMGFIYYYNENNNNQALSSSSGKDIFLRLKIKQPISSNYNFTMAIQAECFDNSNNRSVQAFNSPLSFKLVTGEPTLSLNPQVKAVAQNGSINLNPTIADYTLKNLVYSGYDANKFVITNNRITLKNPRDSIETANVTLTADAGGIIGLTAIATVKFVPTPKVLLGGNNETIMQKSNTGVPLTLSVPGVTVESVSVTNLDTAQTVPGSITGSKPNFSFVPNAAGKMAVKVTYSVDGVSFEVSHEVIVTDPPTIKVTQGSGNDSNKYTLTDNSGAKHENATYSVNVISDKDAANNSLGSITINDNVFTFTRSSANRGGVFVFEAKVSFTGGVFGGITLVSTISINVAGDEMPELSVTDTNGKIEHTLTTGCTATINYVASSNGFSSNGFISWNSATNTYTKLKSVVGGDATITVTAEITSGAYKGIPALSKTITIYVAPVAPTLAININLTGDKVVPTFEQLDVLNPVYTYSVLDNGYNRTTVDENGNITWGEYPNNTDVTIILTVRWANGNLINKKVSANCSKTIAASGKPTLTVTADNNGVLTVSVSGATGDTPQFNVISGASLINFDGVNKKYTANNSVIGGNAVIRVSVTIKDGAYKDTTIDSDFIIYVAPKEPTLSLALNGNTVTPTLESYDADGLNYSYKVLDNGNNKTTVTLNGDKTGTVTWGEYQNDTVVTIILTVSWSNGNLTNKQVSYSVTKTIFASQKPTLKITKGEGADSNNYTLTDSNGIKLIGNYNATVIADKDAYGNSLGSITYNENVFTFTPSNSSRGGLFVFEAQVTLSEGALTGITLYYTVTIEVAASQKPTMTVTDTNKVLSVTVNGATGDTPQFTVKEGANLIDFNVGTKTYSKKESINGGNAVIRVSVNITDGAYSGITLTEDYIIFVAPVMPTLSTSLTDDKLKANLTAPSDIGNVTYNFVSSDDPLTTITQDSINANEGNIVWGTYQTDKLVTFTVTLSWENGGLSVNSVKSEFSYLVKATPQPSAILTDNGSGSAVLAVSNAGGLYSVVYTLEGEGSPYINILTENNGGITYELLPTVFGGKAKIIATITINDGIFKNHSFAVNDYIAVIPSVPSVSLAYSERALTATSSPLNTIETVSYNFENLTDNKTTVTERGDNPNIADVTFFKYQVDTLLTFRVTATWTKADGVTTKTAVAVEFVSVPAMPTMTVDSNFPPDDYITLEYGVSNSAYLTNINYTYDTKGNAYYDLQSFDSQNPSKKYVNQIEMVTETVKLNLTVTITATHEFYGNIQISNDYVYDIAIKDDTSSLNYSLNPTAQTITFNHLLIGGKEFSLTNYTFTATTADSDLTITNGDINDNIISYSITNPVSGGNKTISLTVIYTGTLGESHTVTTEVVISIP